RRDRTAARGDEARRERREVHAARRPRGAGAARHRRAGRGRGDRHRHRDGSGGRRAHLRALRPTRRGSRPRHGRRGARTADRALARARELPAWRGRLAVTRATRLIDDGDYTAAIRTLLGPVAATPRDARVHYYLGLAYARLGVPRGALNQLSDAVRLAPGDARVHDALGQ